MDAALCMACERLIGATIVLGNGEVKEISWKDSRKSAGGKLLWALRGGGGFSYGIVTELILRPLTCRMTLIVSMSHSSPMASLIAVQLTFFSAGRM